MFKQANQGEELYPDNDLREIVGHFLYNLKVLIFDLNDLNELANKNSY